MPLLCRFPPSRHLMLATMAGISRGPLRAPLPVGREVLDYRGSVSAN